MDSYEKQKELKKIRNKRTGRTKKIWGTILVVFGILNLMDSVYMFNTSFLEGLRSCILPLALVCLGVWMVKSARTNVAKWDNYEALINQNGNTPLKELSRKTGKSVDQVRKDVQEMINNGFFRDENGNVGAYIHGEYDILVMMRNGYPKEPVEQTAKEQAQAEAAEEMDGKVTAEEETELFAEAIEKAAAEVKDPDVVESLKSIESSVKKIGRIVKRKPELEESESIRQLREIYLPKTLELVNKLRREEAGPDAMLEIKGILNTCAVAYGNIVEKVYKREDEDTLIDIEVLKQTFEREGLLGSDFDFE